jgi:hypothetical protein
LAEDVDFIRSLIEEARTMKTKPLPGAGSTARNLWNFPSLPHAMVRMLYYGQDSEKEWESDQRRAHVLKRLSAKYPGGVGVSNPGARRELLSYELGELKDIESPYHNRGFFTAGAPLHNMVQYMGAFPSMAYSASAMAANAIDPVAPFDPDAKRKWDSSLNTAGAYVPEALGLVPKGTKTYADVAEDARYARGTVPFDVTQAGKEGRGEYLASVQGDADAASSDLYTDGTEHYMRQGVPRLPALFMGALSDSVLDVYGGWVSAGKLARQGKPAKAAWEMAKEWGLGQTMAGLAAGNELTK